jgi:Trm5-related predicted tRNA methylase
MASRAEVRAMLNDRFFRLTEMDDSEKERQQVVSEAFARYEELTT